MVTAVATLLDIGSTLSFITSRLAKQLKLRGKLIKLSFETVGGNTNFIDTQEYEISMIDCEEKFVTMQVIGIEKISSSISSINTPEIANLFQISVEDISRPTEGEIELLLGVRYAGFHPVRCDHRGHLLLLKNRFGQTFEGTHPQIKEKNKN